MNSGPSQMMPMPGIVNTEAPRQAPIEREAQRLNNVIADLDNALSELIRKIAPVINPITDAMDPGKAQDVARESDMAGMLSEFNARLSNIFEAVSDVTRRVEL